MRSGDADFQLHQLVELLAVVSSFTQAGAATQAAIECAAAVLEAEVAALVRDDRVLASVGFPDDAVPEAELVMVAKGRLTTVEVPGIGQCWAAQAPLASPRDGWLVLARSGGEAFSVAEGNLLRGMARVLRLALRMLETADRERTLREETEEHARENARLLHDLQIRQELIARLNAVRQAVTHREPILDVLRMIIEGARSLLGGAVVELWLLDPDDPVRAAPVPISREGDPGFGDQWRVLADDAPVTRTARAGQQSLQPGRPWVLAVPVHEDKVVRGGVVVQAGHLDDEVPTALEREIVQAFAEHADLALTSARNVKTLEEASRDSLTGLASRRVFREYLQRRISSEDSDLSLMALMFIDLDGFKAINDTYGHGFGDDLLVVVADRITSSIGERDLAARLGGDEFAVMIEEIHEPSEAVVVAERIIAEVSRPVIAQGHRLRVGASVGITFTRPQARDVAELLREADLAMYQAKRNGRGRHEVFVPDTETSFLAPAPLSEGRVISTRTGT